MTTKAQNQPADGQQNPVRLGRTLPRTNRFANPVPPPAPPIVEPAPVSEFKHPYEVYIKEASGAATKLAAFIESFCPGNPRHAVVEYRKAVFMLYSETFRVTFNNQQPSYEDLIEEFLHIFLYSVIEYPADSPREVAERTVREFYSEYGIALGAEGIISLHYEEIATCIAEQCVRRQLDRHETGLRIFYINTLLDCFEYPNE